MMQYLILNENERNIIRKQYPKSYKDIKDTEKINKDHVGFFEGKAVILSRSIPTGGQ